MRLDLEKVRLLVEPVLAELGYELVEARFVTDQGRQVLRVMIDREGGVTVGDCQQASREIETLLEVEEVVGGRYSLEVSSPGLDRPLVKESDFVTYAGRQASVKTSEPIEGRRNYQGFLKGVENRTVVMVIDGQEFRIPLELVQRAHLVY